MSNSDEESGETMQLQRNPQSKKVNKDIRKKPFQKNSQSKKVNKDVPKKPLKRNSQSKNVDEDVPKKLLKRNSQSKNVDEDVPKKLLKRNSQSKKVDEDVPKKPFQKNPQSKKVDKDVPKKLFQRNSQSKKVEMDIFKKSSSLDNIENTIFVGNLPNSTKLDVLKKFFRRFGEIRHARLRCAIRKELKTPKKLAVIKQDFHKDSNSINAFIKFKTFESCKAALKINGTLYEDHHIRVTLAEDKGKSDPKKSVFVGNLAFKVKDDDLWKAFEDCGPIESVRVVRDVRTGIGKGFGYVNFKAADAVELALNLNGVSILDRYVRVSRIFSDAKSNSANFKQRKMTNSATRSENQKKTKVKNSEIKGKPLEKVKTKPEFQGQKTKPTIKKKFKKKKKFDKKTMVIKQIAEGMSKKK